MKSNYSQNGNDMYFSYQENLEKTWEIVTKDLGLLRSTALEIRNGGLADA
jgi:hypothetical protein